MVAPNTSNTGPNPGDTNTTATTQTPVVEVFGTPGDGKVPTWNATTQRFEWGSGSAASVPSPSAPDAGKVVTVKSDGTGYELDATAALSNTTPLIESGSGAPGTGTAASRDDHVHPAVAVPAATGLTGWT